MAPDDLKPGTLLRIKKHCRNNVTIRENGIFGVLINRRENIHSHISQWVVFPNGSRCIYMPINWEVV